MAIFCQINFFQNRKRGFLKIRSSELPAPLLYYVFKSLQKEIFKLAQFVFCNTPLKVSIQTKKQKNKQIAFFAISILCQNRKRGFLKSSSSELPAPLLYYVFKSLQKEIFKLAQFVFSRQQQHSSSL